MASITELLGTLTKRQMVEIKVACKMVPAKNRTEFHRAFLATVEELGDLNADKTVRCNLVNMELAASLHVLPIRQPGGAHGRAAG